jgi:hypothetical protein
VLGRRKTTENAAPTPTAESLVAAGKNRPTPKRREVEAARKQPLIGASRAGTGAKGAEGKAARQQARAAEREERVVRRQRMLSGDEKFLATRDRGPARRLARDAVDGRWNVGELLLPAMLIVLVFSLFASSTRTSNPQVYSAVLALTYLVFLAAGLDAYLLARRIRAAAQAKLGPDTDLKGLRRYAIMRAFQMRRSRIPHPAVTRTRGQRTWGQRSVG